MVRRACPPPSPPPHPHLQALRVLSSTEYRTHGALYFLMSFSEVTKKAEDRAVLEGTFVGADSFEFDVNGECSLDQRT
jgi:hypothetical protein